MVGNGKHSDSYFFSLPVLDNELKLFCWVVDRSEDPFSVDITITKTVDDLKKAIKMEMELDGPAHAFTLWKVSDSYFYSKCHNHNFMQGRRHSRR